MWTTARYVMLTALRDRLFIAALLLVCAVVGISMFLGNIMLIEKQEATIAFAAAGGRAFLSLSLIIFVCFHVRRMLETKEIEVILSRPISRSSVVISYNISFFLIAILLALPLLASLMLIGATPSMGVAVWFFSLLCEAWMMISFALFAALMLSSHVSALLLTITFYIVSRMMGFFLYMLEKPVAMTVDSNFILTTTLKAVSALMPRLDMYAHAAWITRGVEHGLQGWLWLPQTVIYVPLLLFAAILDFRRKQF